MTKLILTTTFVVAAFCIWCEVAFLAVAMACGSSSSQDFCRIGPLLVGGELDEFEVVDCVVVGVTVELVVGVGVLGADVCGTGVCGAAGDAGVGGGVAVTLGVEDAVVDTELEL